MTNRVSIMTGGSNNFATTSEDANAVATDILSDGVIGTITNTSGVAPSTGAGAVNAQGSPNMTVAITGGTFYITATPTGQASQRFRTQINTNSAYTINSNATGGTRYDWIYVQLDATLLANPAAAGDTTASFVTSRSTSSTADNGTPPTYGYCIAVVTVANSASSIANGSIADVRDSAGVSSTANATSTKKNMIDYVESGCVWSGDSYGSTRNASMSSGVVWIGGKRLTVAAVSARAFTASKDVYVDLSDAGNGTATVVYYDNTTNAASPSFATTGGTMRLAIVVVGASSIANVQSINQGQVGSTTSLIKLPNIFTFNAIAFASAGTDSIGNRIAATRPYDSLVGGIVRTATATTGNPGATPTAWNGCNYVPFIAVANTNYKFVMQEPAMSGTSNNDIHIYEVYLGATANAYTTSIGEFNVCMISGQAPSVNSTLTFNSGAYSGLTYLSIKYRTNNTFTGTLYLNSGATRTGVYTIERV